MWSLVRNEIRTNSAISRATSTPRQVIVRLKTATTTPNSGDSNNNSRPAVNPERPARAAAKHATQKNSGTTEGVMNLRHWNMSSMSNMHLSAQKLRSAADYPAHWLKNGSMRGVAAWYRSNRAEVSIVLMVTESSDRRR